MKTLIYLFLSLFVVQASAEKPAVSEQKAQEFAVKCVFQAEKRAVQEGITMTHPSQSIIVAADPSVSIVIIMGITAPSWKRSGYNSETVYNTHTCQNGEIL